jgi:glutamate N-acetyltransferase/amino-acid N-acetyltransferase
MTKRKATVEGIEVLPGGSVTTPRGFLASGIHVGVRTDWTKLDVALLHSEVPCVAAATTTKNTMPGASLVISRQHLADGSIQAVVANSGCANAATGQQGLDDAIAMAQATGKKLGIDPHNVVVASTGVIGTYLPMDKILSGIEKMTPSTDGGLDFLTGIMTTDTVQKHVAVRGGDWTIGGVTKGAGMIHPNMATMLCFVTTDAAVERAFLQAATREAVDASFNQIDIDSDTSPDDIVLVLANGMASGDAINDAHPEATLFRSALTEVCVTLARKMVADAEGATHVIEANVTGAKTVVDARLAAREIVRSLAVKTAVYGRDPNWGRIHSAVGQSGAEAKDERMTIWLGNPNGDDICCFKEGIPQPYDVVEAKECFSPHEVFLRVDLGMGDASGTAWGSDLTENYVKLNAEYTT